MPVEGGAFHRRSDVVVDSDFNPVTPVGLYQWAWILVIDKDDIPKDAVSADPPTADSEVVVSSDVGHWDVAFDRSICVLRRCITPGCSSIRIPIAVIEPLWVCWIAKCAPG